MRINVNRGFSLLESMLALLIGAMLVGMLLESVVMLYQQGIWLSYQQSANAQADGVRWYLCRDLYYADELKVEDREGTRFTVSGCASALYSVPDELIGVAGGMAAWGGNTNRFRVLYVFHKDAASARGTLVRYGPRYIEVPGSQPTMTNLQENFALFLSRDLQLPDTGKVFSVDGRGRVSVDLLLRQGVEGLIAGATNALDRVRSTPIHITAFAQRL